MDDVARIAAGLSEARREAARLFPDDWLAGPDAPDNILEQLQGLRESGIVERTFADMGPPDTSETIDGFHVKIGACWWFRLTPLGQAVRAHLLGEG